MECIKMSAIYSVVIVVALTSSASAYVNVATNGECGYTGSARRGRILNGTEAGVSEFPWLVSLRDFSGGHMCGGFIIHQRYVVTAAHCVRGVHTPKHVHVLAGEHLQKPVEPFQKRTPVNIYKHPNWTKNYVNDIALLEFDEEFSWSDRVRPICLPEYHEEKEGTTDPLNNKMVTIAGWGLTDERQNGGKLADTLRKVELPIVPQATCQDWYNEIQPLIVLYDSHLCAGFEIGNKDSCKGDSGGPMMYKNEADGRKLAVGVVSVGIGCGRPKAVGIYTRVSRYINWITDHVKNTPKNIRAF